MGSYRRLAIRSPHRDASPTGSAISRSRNQTPPYLDQAQQANSSNAVFRLTHLSEHDPPRLSQKDVTSRANQPSAAKSAFTSQQQQQQRLVQPISVGQPRQVIVPPQKQPPRYPPPPLQYAPSHPPRQGPRPPLELAPVRSSYFSRPLGTPASSVQTGPSPVPWSDRVPPQRTPISLPSRLPGYGAIRQHGSSNGGGGVAKPQWPPTGGQQTGAKQRTPQTNQSTSRR